MPIAIMPTASGLTLSLPGKSVPLVISNSHSQYDAVISILHEGTGDEQAQKIIDLIEGPARKIEKALENSELSDKLVINAGCVLYMGHPLENYMAKKLLELIKAGFPVTPLARFIEKVMQNPIPSVINRLYAFLEKGQIPITEDGDFEGYKVVREDYLDHHTSSISNKVGACLEMPRWMVDDNPNNTCSSGLHICSYNYIKEFTRANSRLMVCKVNPMDVVSIPVDYNDTKMRVCKYEVIREVEEYYMERKVDNVLSRSPISQRSDNSAIFAIFDTEEKVAIKEFLSLSEAAQFFESATNDYFCFESTRTLELFNQVTDVTIDTKIIEVEPTADNDSIDDTDDESTDYLGPPKPFRVIFDDTSDDEGFDSLIGALAYSKEMAEEGKSGRIENQDGQLLRKF